MEMTCTNCCAHLRPGAKLCGHCGCGVVRALELVSPRPEHDIVTPPIVHAPLAHHHADELVARMQLEVMTRLNPLMNHERMKAMVIAIAAHGGTGTVGFWSDD